MVQKRPGSCSIRPSTPMALWGYSRGVTKWSLDLALPNTTLPATSRSTMDAVDNQAERYRQRHDLSLYRRPRVELRWIRVRRWLSADQHEGAQPVLAGIVVAALPEPKRCLSSRGRRSHNLECPAPGTTLELPATLARRIARPRVAVATAVNFFPSCGHAQSSLANQLILACLRALVELACLRRVSGDSAGHETGHHRSFVGLAPEVVTRE
jgi:hypothetical protein